MRIHPRARHLLPAIAFLASCSSPALMPPPGTDGSTTGDAIAPPLDGTATDATGSDGTLTDAAIDARTDGVSPPDAGDAASTVGDAASDVGTRASDAGDSASTVGDAASDVGTRASDAGDAAPDVVSLPPVRVLINEIEYDSQGTDTQSGNTLFLELWAPASSSLDGYEVVGIDGATGNVYATIPLDGEVVGDDGYYLIAHPSGDTALVALADYTSALVDFQNGPDSVQVRWHGQVVDALGYGTFGAGTTFAGEGTATGLSGQGHSLSRNASHADTDDNSADFSVNTVASPRGHVPVTCTDECPSDGTTQCVGTSVQTCGNYDADSCREWSTAVACGAGTTCIGSACGTIACTDECPSNGATQCAGTQVQVCGNYDSDGCREWSSASNCATGLVCVASVNACAVPCTDACTAGATQCSGTSVQSCVTGADGCRAWSAATSCGAGLVCIGTACTVACTDACAAGATQCSGTSVQSCVTGASGCRVWSTAAACASGMTCQGTACAVACTDACAAGATQCSGTNVQTCVTGASGCRVWSTATACGGGQTCVGTACTTQCTDACPSNGATQCVGPRQQTCATAANGCRVWLAEANCPTGQTCQATACAVPCTDACASVGATQCGSGGLQTCVTAATGCRAWSAGVSCGTGMTCTGSSCAVANAPEVVLISPQGTIQTTQGRSHHMVVDATAAAGRTIAQVRYYANGMLVGMSATTPYTFDYVVPASAATGSAIALNAQATDSAGAVGSSASATLNVRNDLPVASFAATITNINASTSTGTVTVDASAVTDTETAASALQVCWDWDNDGTCDTAYSTTKVATHDFVPVGMNDTRTIRMVVKDAVGQTTSTTRDVTFTALQYVGGVTLASSTLWYGTVVITGNVVVPAGVTLTIAAGTQVLFIRNDTVAPLGIGDYGIDVAGVLTVNGTSAQPVSFTGQNTAAKTPGSWDRIILRGGTASTISNAVIEYADYGLDVRNGSTVTNTTVRSATHDCILLNNGDNATFTDVTVTACAGNGVDATAGSTGVVLTRVSATACTLSGVNVTGGSSVAASTSHFDANTKSGATADTGSTFNVSDSTLSSNTGTGLAYLSTATGTATHDTITANGAEGVSLVQDNAGSPTPVVNYNNIYGNAVTGSNTYTAVTLASNTIPSTTTSGTFNTTYTAPAGTTIRRVRAYAGEYDPYGYVTETLLANTTAVAAFSASGSFAWYYLPAGTTSVTLRVVSTYNGSSYYGYGSISDVEYGTAAGATDVTGNTSSTVDARYNYLGTFPNVLSRVSLSTSTALNVQGFVGTQFDSTWSTGIYKAGAQSTATWSGTVYITGDTTIAAGQTVTIAAGAQVLFVKHDQNGDGNGDFSLTATGLLNVNGASGSLVAFDGQGTNPSGNAFQSITLGGTGTSTWSNVTVSHGLYGVVISSPSTLGNIVVNAGSFDGVTVRNATGANLSNLTVTGAGRYGLLLENGDNVTVATADLGTSAVAGLAAINGSTGGTLGRVSIHDGAGYGLLCTGGSTPTLQDSTVRNNGTDGIHLTDSAATIQYDQITYNHGAGVWIEGTGAATLQYDVIKYNNDVGVYVGTAPTGSPTPSISNSNIYGNSVTGSSTGTLVTLASNTIPSTTTSGTFNTTYTAPAGTTIRRVRAYAGEYDPYGYVTETLLANTTAVAAFSASGSFAWYYLPAGTTSVTLRVVSTYNGSSYYGYGSISDVEYGSTSASSHYELAAATDTGTTLARTNFWTSNVGDVPSLIYQGRANSVDYMGYTGAEYPSGAVTQVGPRP